MSWQARPKAAWLIGAQASLGVMLAHWLAYFLVEPDAHHRRELLADTGHGSTTVAVALSLGLLVAAWVHLSRTRPAARRVRAIGFWGGLVRLSAIQILGFVLLEALERAVVHSGVPELLSEPVVVLGIALQAISALVGTWILAIGARAIRAIIEALRPSFSRRAAAAPARYPMRLAPARFTVAVGEGTLRGPPSFA